MWNDTFSFQENELRIRFERINNPLGSNFSARSRLATLNLELAKSESYAFEHP